MKNQKIKCSNCGKESEYTEQEVKKSFPFSRELLKCKYCKKSFSVNSWFLGM